MTYFVMRFGDDAGNEPNGVWTDAGMSKAGHGVDHTCIVPFKDEEDAWNVVARHHKSGEVWGVVSSRMLARKLRTGRYT